MTKRKPKRAFADRKISETFLHFAQPLLDAHGTNATESQMEQPLKIAWTVWNAVVYADVAVNVRILEGIRASTGHDPELAAFIEYLITRKRRHFGDDRRLIGEYKLFRKDGEIRLRAEARDPLSTQR